MAGCVFLSLPGTRKEGGVKTVTTASSLVAELRGRKRVSDFLALRYTSSAAPTIDCTAASWVPRSGRISTFYTISATRTRTTGEARLFCWLDTRAFVFRGLNVVLSKKGWLPFPLRRASSLRSSTIFR